LVSITGKNTKDWQDKLKEIEKYKLDEVALFLEWYERPEREKIYKAIEKSCIKKIPFCHARHDMEKEEFVYLSRQVWTNHFNIHEECFKNLEKWKGIYKKLYLEMNYDDFVPHAMKVKKIGGFCIDLSHFMASRERDTKDFDYVMERKNLHKLFVCNHLNGYDWKKKKDKHTITSLKDFDYLKTLPKFVFGKIIAIETYNSIKEQLRFKKYLEKMLEKLF
ncbi:MAG: hypothetical protein U9P90_03145, partial [Patescibacteria group bacterium]|nr:hypothetical protein [Patescibacteria group bacterium]